MNRAREKLYWSYSAPANGSSRRVDVYRLNISMTINQCMKGIRKYHEEHGYFDTDCWYFYIQNKYFKAYKVHVNIHDLMSFHAENLNARRDEIFAHTVTNNKRVPLSTKEMKKWGLRYLVGFWTLWVDNNENTVYGFTHPEDLMLFQMTWL